ncbi:cupin domain-containing protein [Burkholderia vietnamiensis]|uniref:cupin domain-containing protein n=1 Tax=Burkholderia vietnamiensis TaxID=60552 RepID=UPI001E510C2D|nr:cupin domain-containing protein [Burkholderia vietnamiensis]
MGRCRAREPRSQLVHVSQNCGNWKASTAGCANASFHIILHGSAWLHYADRRGSIPVAAGNAVFLLPDMPHGLSPSLVNQRACAVAGSRPLERRVSLQRLAPSVNGSVALACGFIELHSTVSHAIVSLLELGASGGCGDLRNAGSRFDHAGAKPHSSRSYLKRGPAEAHLAVHTGGTDALRAFSASAIVALLGPGGTRMPPLRPRECHAHFPQFCCCDPLSVRPGNA